MNRQRKDKVENGIVGGAGKERSPESTVPTQGLVLWTARRAQGASAVVRLERKSVPEGYWL